MNTKENHKNIPIIKCLPRKITGFNDAMTFWCPFCETWHQHGRGNGHRVEHCCKHGRRDLKDSPFHEAGYTIKMMSKAELKKIRADIDSYLKQKAEEQ